MDKKKKKEVKRREAPAIAFPPAPFKSENLIRMIRCGDEPSAIIAEYREEVVRFRRFEIAQSRRVRAIMNE